MTVSYEVYESSCNCLNPRASLSFIQVFLQASSPLHLVAIRAVLGQWFRTNPFGIALLPPLDRTWEFRQQC
ncbi:hypothetical protein RO3G_06784 [Rhizopus delemar RA 99-880]|uniref:Uncharacterized protein n=1 Tax=Rhizopus delemar (strain RA 99-880 / ATCC MYA-4621 / FGSC 9543 / NRRL 43880) TaxID=246409 RepID=I1C0U9_RHIO9|nr:hypothetical protein RO3G_06784 [Rhizopus delemar RA 99-880]|eukprot:EIE82079.1 hypothetical protein RO3G_06784 [Rhizopus delemar RA 99-880]